MKIASFDIFDTLLLLSCGNEEQMFRILGYNILGNDVNLMDLCEFIRIRKMGEQTAHMQTTTEDITTEDIYKQCDFSALTAVPNSDIMETEFSLMAQLLIPIWKNIACLKKYRQQGYHIIFISDMHLPEKVLKEVLMKWHIMEEEYDKIYVSSEYLKTKHHGTLYQHIFSDLNNNISTWHHYGDNHRSDYLMAKRNGIKAHLLSSPVQLPYTGKAIYSETNYIEQPRKLIASIVRSIYQSDYEDIYRKLVLDIIAPLFVSQVYDILNDAHNKKIKQLLFFARDSYMFYLIAKEFSVLFPDIKLTYFYVSRRTLYLPCIEDISYTSFLKLKGIKGLSAQDYLDQFGLDIKDLELPVDKDKLSTEQLLHTILSNDFNIKKIESVRNTMTSHLLKYFRQEVTDMNNVGMVDITGSRSSQEALNRLFKRKGHNSLFAYYLLVSEDRKSIKDAGQFKASLLCDFMKNGIQKYIGDLVLLLEDVFSVTDQNRTVSYQEANHQITPIFDASNNEKKTEVMNTNTTLFTQVAKGFISCHAYNCNNEILSISIWNLGHFAMNPRYEYVKAIELFTISENGNSQQAVISRLWRKDFKKSWFRGSLVGSFRYSNFLLTVLMWIKNKKYK